MAMPTRTRYRQSAPPRAISRAKIGLSEKKKAFNRLDRLRMR